MLHRNGNLLRRAYSFPSAAVSPHRRRPFRPPPAAAAAEDRLKALCKSGRLEEALLEMALLREAMVCSSYDALLTESMNQRSLRSGQRVHAHITKTRYLPPIYLSNRIIVLYAKCGEPQEARKMLELMPQRTVVSWTAVISGFSRGDTHGVAIQLLVKMIREGTSSPNEFTLATVLTSCAGNGNLENGEQVHALAIKTGLKSQVFVGSSLLDMYAKSGEIHGARRVFDEMPQRDVVSCTAIVSGYAQLGHHRDALELFKRLLGEGMAPNSVTFAGVLTALSGLSALHGGRQLHGRLIRAELPFHVEMENSLVDMYCKSGCLVYARRVFDGMPQRTVASWNSILAGYGRHGLGREALAMFDSMVEEGVNPDGLTFLAVLSGCGHGGLVNEGLRIFHRLMNAHSVLPGMEHYGCMVDLLGRAGMLEKATEIIREMPFEPTTAIWASLLGASRAHSNIPMAEFAAQMIFKTDPRSSGSYVNLANVYAVKGRWEDTFRLRKMMAARRLPKEPGRSWIEIERPKMCDEKGPDLLGEF